MGSLLNAVLFSFISALKKLKSTLNLLTPNKSKNISELSVLSDLTCLGSVDLNGVCIVFEKSVGTKELHYDTKKWEHSLSTLKSFFRPTLVRV